MEIMKVLVVEPNKKPYVKEIGGDLHSLQTEVEDYIEAVYPFDDYNAAIICAENGKSQGKPYNRALRDEHGRIYDFIAGTFLIVGILGEDLVSISDEDIKTYSKVFEVPERLFLQDDGRYLVLRDPVKEEKPDATPITQEIARVLVSLGVDITNKTVKTQREYGSLFVYVEGEYFGIWDEHRKTFID